MGASERQREEEFKSDIWGKRPTRYGEKDLAAAARRSRFGWRAFEERADFAGLATWGVGWGGGCEGRWSGVGHGRKSGAGEGREVGELSLREVLVEQRKGGAWLGRGWGG